jgi:leucine-rich PPR motif-containing protein
MVFANIIVLMKQSKCFQIQCSKGLQLDIFTINIMIGALLKGGRREDAMDLFATISAYGLHLDVETYCLIAENLIKEGSLEELDGLFSAMEENGTAPNSCMLNALVRRLLHRGDISRDGAYLSKLDEKNFSLETSTTSMFISLHSRGEYQQHAKSLPDKYHFLSLTAPPLMTGGKVQFLQWMVKLKKVSILS